MKQLSNYYNSIREIEQYFGLEKYYLSDLLIDDNRDDYWYTNDTVINWCDEAENKFRLSDDPEYSYNALGVRRGEDFTLIRTELGMGHNSEVVMIFSNANEYTDEGIYDE